MDTYSTTLAALGGASLALLLISGPGNGISLALGSIAILGGVLSSWVGNGVLSVRVKR